MGRTPRLSGSLEIGDAVRTALAELRLIFGIDQAPTLDLVEVRALERAVQDRLPDEVLALFAAGLVPMAGSHDLTLEKAMATTGRVHALGGRGDLVGLAREPQGYLCWEKGASRQPLLMQHFDPATRSTEAQCLEAVLQTWIRSARQTRPQAPRFDPGLAVTFAPRTVMPLPGGSDGRPVLHKVFGEGRVLVEKGAGPKRKVKVDFPGHGMKVLQARFLTFLDETDEIDKIAESDG